MEQPRANAPTQVQRIRRAVAAACSPLGIKEHDIIVSARGISVPSAGLSLSAELSGGVRVWRAANRFHVMSVLPETEREMTTVLFEEPFEREWQVARRIALHIAETRIDAAIDEATA